MELVVHWWNGRFEHATRQDVFVLRDEDRFVVELRVGGPHGTTTETSHRAAWEAITAARDYLVPLHEWSDVTDAHRRAYPGK